ncbi:MAG: hypothetical protein PHH61_06190 [Candidatus Nanoarchaeia archaeon]|jgi:hypothetical protein|nr:hypothetical protein [Candidatus Nanoarchaeia archaeon]
MTEIIYYQAQLSKTEKDALGFKKLIHVPKKVSELEIHKAGEDGQYLWMKFTFEDGETEETGYYKETT